MTTPGKNYPGQKGFPTPQEIPEEQGYLLFLFPNSNDWAGVLLGAANLLTSEYNWFQWGDMLPDEAAEAWKDIVIQAPYNTIGSQSIGTPFWDEASDVDDEMPKDAQPWYGYVTNPEAPPEELDFVENATIWALTGMLAVATWEIGFAPAILFHTIAPKFGLAVKRGDLGEIIRIFMDGEEAARVDTTPYSPGEVIRVRIVGDPEEEEHDLMIVQMSQEEV